MAELSAAIFTFRITTSQTPTNSTKFFKPCFDNSTEPSAHVPPLKTTEKGKRKENRRTVRSSLSPNKMYSFGIPLHAIGFLKILLRQSSKNIVAGSAIKKQKKRNVMKTEQPTLFIQRSYPRTETLTASRLSIRLLFILHRVICIFAVRKLLRLQPSGRKRARPLDVGRRAGH